MSFLSRLQDRITSTFRAGVERVQSFFTKQPPPTEPQVKKEVERVEVDLEAKIKEAVERATKDYQTQLDNLEKRNSEALERLQRRIEEKDVTIQQLQTPTDQPLDVFAGMKKQNPEYKQTPYYYRFAVDVIDEQDLEITVVRTIRSQEPISIQEGKDRLIQLYQDSTTYNDTVIVQSIRFLGALEVEK